MRALLNPPPLVFQNWHVGSHHGQQDYVLMALTPEGSERLSRGEADRPTRDMLLGYANYALFDGDVHLNMIEVRDDVQRQGVGTALWHELKRLWPGRRFPPGYQTAAGAALRGAVGMERGNPPALPWVQAPELYVSPRQRALTPHEAFVREVSVDLKHGDPRAVEIAASAMAPLVRPGSVLVPAPSSKPSDFGGVVALADRLAGLTGGEVRLLVARHTAVESSRVRRRAGGTGLQPEHHESTMFLAEAPPPGRHVVIVDNVIVSGATMEGARRVLGLQPGDVSGVAYSSAEAPP